MRALRPRKTLRAIYASFSPPLTIVARRSPIGWYLQLSAIEYSRAAQLSERGWPYLSGEKSVGVTNVDSTLPTSGPAASDVSRIDFHDGSLRKSSHDFFAASRLSCDST